MLLWIGFAVLTGGVIAALLRPLARKASDAVDAGTADLGVYREQLGAIEAEKDRGLLDSSEVEAARTELARRLLRAAESAASDSASPPPRDSGRSSRIGNLTFILAALVPLATVGIYVTLGSPQMAGQPHSERLKAASNTKSVDELVGLVEARLRQQPDDVQGWEVLAPVYVRAGRFRDAAVAYRNSIRLAGETPRRLSGLAEALILAENGLVVPEARGALQRLKAIEPERPEARFWMAIAREQDGDVKGAIADLEDMLKTAQPDASWRQLVEGHVAELKAKGSGDQTAASRPPQPMPSVPRSEDAPAGVTAPSRGEGPAGASGGGPSGADIEAASRMSAGERAQMIEKMVAGLSARLEKDGRDLDGWMKLVRAYKVMGRDGDARAAFERAKKGLAGDEASLKSLDDLARSLGLGS
ncbi:MAG: c-type cytochrome biogenesis protein CcmI [Hyphomicrobiaceae bacterium]|nr:c-type cytochrome biogenesis protein CcmI [Hyphomicrobiaceae bacterium]